MSVEWHIAGYEKPQEERLIDVDWIVATEKLNEKASPEFVFQRADERLLQLHDIVVTKFVDGAPVQYWKHENGEWV